MFVNGVSCDSFSSSLTAAVVGACLSLREKNKKCWQAQQCSEVSNSHLTQQSLAGLFASPTTHTQPRPEELISTPTFARFGRIMGGNLRDSRSWAEKV